LPRTYCGYSNNFARRIRAHNAEVSGGAKYTRKGKPWAPLFVVSGFCDKVQGLCFEWAIKHARKGFGRSGRIRALNHVINLDRWTRKCPDSREVPLKIQWFDRAAHAASRSELRLPPQVVEETAF
jgi:hypothetical protein